MNKLDHKLEDTIEIVRILAKPQRKIRQQGVLFKYKTPDKPDKVQDYRAKSFQTVTEVCVEVGRVPKNTVIVKCKEGCLHPIVAFGLCTECGKDLKDDDSVNTGRSVSMLHSIPQVYCVYFYSTCTLLLFSCVKGCGFYFLVCNVLWRCLFKW